MNNVRLPLRMTVAIAAIVLSLPFLPAPARAAGIAGIAGVGAAIGRRGGPPAYLPTSIPDNVVGGGGVRASLVSSDASSFVVAFSQGRKCARPACRFGFMRASADAGALPTGLAVKLPGGRSATFARGACDAGCAASTLTWTAGGMRYVLGLRGAGENALRFMAASVRRF